ncbi:hypothetical protein H105_06103 [Trichophyton soudanense CBS 452.61]|uniref:Uncharacterized protein n=1 Tax=Trichophyton soudanense CBS 452.61 TaxID=1215331 RepID=A0A022XLM9_TRISD|nr:hypothetical protein H105_06103 [Trichophyton soudanense CBS 452.61]EZG04263.1 hypothetical protein H106_05926 [Trichophyton rubrum CBS 735.88]
MVAAGGGGGSGGGGDIMDPAGPRWYLSIAMVLSNNQMHSGTLGGGYSRPSTDTIIGDLKGERGRERNEQEPTRTWLLKAPAAWFPGSSRQCSACLSAIRIERRRWAVYTGIN